MKVLLVEDEASLADVLSRNLRVRGFDVVAVETVAEAMASLAKRLPGGLVLDVNLPDEAGWEVLRRMGAEIRERLRVVVISAAPLSTKRLAEFRPARAFVKPFPIEALVRALSPESAQPTADEEVGVS